MGTRFDSGYRRNAFDCGRRNNAFDVHGVSIGYLDAEGGCACSVEAEATATRLDPPDAPSNLTLSWGTLVIAGYRKVVATWQDNSDNEDGFHGMILDSAYWDSYSGWKVGQIPADTTTKSGNSGRAITNSQWARFRSWRQVLWAGGTLTLYSDWTYSPELPPYGS